MIKTHGELAAPRTKPAAAIVAAVLVGFFLCAAGAAAQGAPKAPAATEAPVAFETLPRGFRGAELGMTLKEVTLALGKDELFFYRGAPDVTLLPRPDEKLLEVQGLSYVKRAFFQFLEDRLFSAIYVLNPDLVDHYSIFTQFSARYGKATELSPRESIWTDGVVRVSLERPLTVKYVDVAVLEQLRKAGEVKQSWEEMSRQDFLKSF